MTTLSVPITKELDDFIKAYIASGEAENKAQVVRKSLRKLKEEQAWKHIEEGMLDIKHGRVYQGDLKTLLKKI